MYGVLASLGVVHPVENDLRRPVPPGHHVARHLCIGTASQPKVQDLDSTAPSYNGRGGLWVRRYMEDLV